MGDLVHLKPIKARVVLPLQEAIREQYLALLAEQTSKYIAAQELFKSAQACDSETRAGILNQQAHVLMADCDRLKVWIRSIEARRDRP